MNSITAHARTITLALATLFCIGEAYADATLYVSPAGNDSWSGRLKSANRTRTDGPKKTLLGIRNGIRTLRGNGSISGTITVIVQNGTYSLPTTFTLESQDGGTASNPVIYRAATPNKVFIDGGKVLTLWKSIAKAEQQYLKPAVRKKVLQCNLNQMGILDTGALTNRGANYTTTTVSELFFDGKKMTLARYPNTGWLTIPSDHDSAYNTSFKCSDPTIQTWKFNNKEDIWAYGYFHWNWADSYEKVGSIDSTGKVTLSTIPNHGIYMNQRYFFTNVFEELDSPGEYYINRKTNMLYFYPPNRSVGRRVTLSLLDHPLVRFDAARYVRMEGFVIQNGRSAGVEFRNSLNCSVIGGTVRNFNVNAVKFVNGFDNVLDSVDITSTGERAVLLGGGDRYTLTPGRNIVRNCKIYDYSNYVRTYNPGVDIYGCGNTVANNRIENAPHQAVVIHGNNHLVEKNEVSRVCLETGDSGAIYIGRDPTERGNIIRYNLIQDVWSSVWGNQYDHPDTVWAIYFDDLACGTTAHGNIIRRCMEGIQIGGGRDNIVTNNVFDSCGNGVHVDARGLSWAKDKWQEWGFQQKLNDVKHNLPPYSTAYPQLATYLQERPMAPRGNVINANVCVGQKMLKLLDGLQTTTDLNSAEDGKVAAANNYVGLNPGFVNLSANDIRLMPGAKIGQMGFAPFDTSQIGLYESSYRKTVEPLYGSQGRPTP